jgi:hypothetical protein
MHTPVTISRRIYFVGTFSDIGGGLTHELVTDVIEINLVEKLYKMYMIKLNCHKKCTVLKTVLCDVIHTVVFSC